MNSHREGQWYGSPNMTPQRQGAPVRYVVLHTMDGTVESATARFENDAVPMQQRASAHYGVGSDGRVVQFVDECDGSWANGDWNMNMESIAIEHEDMGEYNGPRPDALYTTSAALVRGICERYGIPIDRAHILDHRQVTQTSCPDALDTDRIVREAAVASPPPIAIEDDEDMSRSLPIPGAPTGPNTFVVALPTSDEVVVIAWDHGTRRFDTVTDLGGQLHTLEEALYDNDALIVRGVNGKGEAWRYDSTQNPAWSRA